MRLTWGTLCFLAVLWSVTPSLAAQTLHLVAAKADLEGPDLHIATATPESAAAIPGTASGGQYVTGFHDSANHVVFTVPVGETGIYDLRIGYRSDAHRGYELTVNDLTISGVFFPNAPAFGVQKAGQIELRHGNNTVSIGAGWGNYDIAYIEVAKAPAPIPFRQPATNLVDPKATPEARALLHGIERSAEQGTLMGVYSDNDAQYVHEMTGSYPAIMGGDLSGYSPASAARETQPDNEAEKMVAYAREGYLLTLSWHWVPPFGLLNRTIPANNGKQAVDAHWYKGFYTNATNFDVSIATEDPQSLERKLLLRDIDAIAVQLRKLQDANIPVLWRPLHEAQGGWFWWGAKGPVPFIQLWRLMYDRLVNTDGVHNLIWVYTSADDPAWYPGDAFVDMIGVDAYPGDLRDTQSESWMLLEKQFAGRKPLCLSEFGGVPDVPRMRRMGIDWAYAVSWSGSEGPRKNAADSLKAIYADPQAIKRGSMTATGTLASRAP